MERARLIELLEEKTRHLPLTDDAHFHVVVSADEEGDWDFPEIIPSPPYGDKSLAERDAHDPDLVARVRNLNVDVLECRRACPRSGLGDFGWEDGDNATAYRWWQVFGRNHG